MPTLRLDTAMSVLMTFAVPLSSAAATHKYSQPFGLAGRGVGGSPVDGSLVLEPGTEISSASKVLISTLQDLQFGLQDRKDSLSKPLAPLKEYRTDIVPIDEGTIARHNSLYKAMQLSNSFHFALQYALKYSIDQSPRSRAFLIEVNPILYYRGDASTNWHPYRMAYSGEFFADMLFSNLKARFKAFGSRNE